MNYIKKIGISVLISLGIILVSTFIFSLFEYWGLISYKLMKIILVIIPLLAFLIGGFLFGKRSRKKGWLEGLKLSLIDVIIFVFINLVLANLKNSSVISYLCIIIPTTIGSIIGVNNKKVS